MKQNDLWFLDKNRNDKFLDMDVVDYLEFISNMEVLMLEYRDKLDLDKKLTFGLEIEFEDINLNKVSKYLKNNLKTWKCSSDDSLNSGGEIKSNKLHDQKKKWLELKKICEYLKQNNANASRNSAAQIHIGAHILGDDVEAWRKFIKVYSIYEPVLFRFSYGDKINARKDIDLYASPINKSIADCSEELSKTEDLEKFIYILKHKLYADLNLLKTRFTAINFNNVLTNDIFNNNSLNTIEFRSPNGTLEEVIWQNNVNTFANLILNSKNADEEYLDYRLKSEELPISDLCREIDIKEAFELADTIFDNNFDKTYFLRQYFKDFRSGGKTKETILSKRFVK